MRRSFLVALALLATPSSVLATPTTNPFECNVPIEALPASLGEFRIVAERTQRDPSNFYDIRAVVYDPSNIYVLGREARYLALVRSGDAITLSAIVNGPLEDVRSTVNDRAAQQVVWVCSSRNDCGAVAPSGLLLRLSAAPDERTAVDTPVGRPAVVLSCTYNAGLRGLAPAL